MGGDRGLASFEGAEMDSTWKSAISVLRGRGCAAGDDRMPSVQFPGFCLGNHADTLGIDFGSFLMEMFEV